MKKSIFLYIAAALLALAGILLQTLLAGYTYAAYVCYGIGAVLIAWDLLAKLQKKKARLAISLRRTMVIILILGILAAGITGALILSAAGGSSEPPCRYLIVLGAGVNGTEPSSILQDRINAAYDYLTANPDVICIPSGGQGKNEDITEAECIFRALTEKGIDPERIWLEERSTSTRENLEFSLALIEERTGSRPETLDLLSNEFHLYRSCQVAKEMGITAHGVAARTSRPGLFFSSFVREIIALWYYMIT